MGLVLCGGLGRRMNGSDKGLIDVGGTPAATLVAAAMRPHCEQVIINANRNMQRYRDLDLGPIVQDRRPGFCGPLAGIEAAAAATDADIFLVLPCDLISITEEIPGSLLAHLRSHRDLDAVYAQCGERAHYLCAALRVSAMKGLEWHLNQGGRSVNGWYRTQRSEPLMFDAARHQAAFENRNYPGDQHG
ncbi:MAG: molybdenum cofactor guanylyltransferase [Congregibacter sp.]